MHKQYLICHMNENIHSKKLCRIDYYSQSNCNILVWYNIIMTTTTFIILIILLLAPMIYQRGRYALQPEHFYKITIRKKSGLQIHHAHWGLIWIFISSIWFIFGDKSIYPILMAGLGWGLILDEIIPHLRMPSDNRTLELDIYKKATKPTIILISIVTIIFIGLFIATH